jgi:hypothetical protein
MPILVIIPDKIPPYSPSAKSDYQIHQYHSPMDSPRDQADSLQPQKQIFSRQDSTNFSDAVEQVLKMSPVTTLNWLVLMLELVFRGILSVVIRDGGRNEWMVILYSVVG